MLLVGTGTGLAPLVGVVRTALASGHGGQVHLYHGSSKRDGLYLVDELRELADRAPNFHYVPCVSRESVPKGFQQCRAHALAFAVHDSLAGWQVHLAGNPDMVDAATALAEKAGAKPEDICADAFVLKDLRTKNAPSPGAGRRTPTPAAASSRPTPRCGRP